MRTKFTLLLGILTLAIAGAAPAAQAAVIQTENGDVLEGALLETDASPFTVESMLGMMACQWDNIGGVEVIENNKTQASLEAGISGDLTCQTPINLWSGTVETTGPMLIGPFKGQGEDGEVPLRVTLQRKSYPYDVCKWEGTSSLWVSAEKIALDGLLSSDTGCSSIDFPAALRFELLSDPVSFVQGS